MGDDWARKTYWERKACYFTILLAHTTIKSIGIAETPLYMSLSEHPLMCTLWFSPEDSLSGLQEGLLDAKRASLKSTKHTSSRNMTMQINVGTVTPFQSRQEYGRNAAAYWGVLALVFLRNNVTSIYFMRKNILKIRQN